MYGVLKGTENTGSDDELAFVFSTPLNIISNQPAFASDTLSLRRTVNSQGVQRWEIEAEIAPTNDSAEMLIHTVLNNNSKVFGIRMPQIYRNKAVSNNLNLVLTTTKAKGSTSIDISGTNNNDLRGQFITFANSGKVYLITDNGVAGAGYKIQPPLLIATASSTPITYGDKVTMKARYDIDTILGQRYVDGILASQGTMKFVEAL